MSAVQTEGLTFKDYMKCPFMHEKIATQSMFCGCTSRPQLTVPDTLHKYVISWTEKIACFTHSEKRAIPPHFFTSRRLSVPSCIAFPQHYETLDQKNIVEPELDDEEQKCAPLTVPSLNGESEQSKEQNESKRRFQIMVKLSNSECSSEEWPEVHQDPSEKVRS